MADRSDGLRQKKVAGATTAYYLRDGDNVVQEHNASLVNTVRYTDLPGVWGGKFGIKQSGTGSSFLLPDFQGNTRQLTNISQAITDTLLTDAWGREVATTGTTTNPFRAFGQYGYFRDTTSRLYVNARHLDVTSGRWLSRDPIGFWGGSANLYGYTWNDPVRWIDPGGLVPPLGQVFQEFEEAAQSAVPYYQQLTNAVQTFSVNAVPVAPVLVGTTAPLWVPTVAVPVALAAGTAAAAYGGYQLSDRFLAPALLNALYGRQVARQLAMAATPAPGFAAQYQDALRKTQQKKKELECQMRFQLQMGRHGVTFETLPVVRTAPPELGVSVNAGQRSIHDLWLRRREAHYPAGRTAERPFIKSKAELTRALATYPPTGWYGPMQTIQNRHWDIGRDEWRIDVEHIRGHNLRY